MKHSFDVGIATDMNILAAVILDNIAHWVWHNETNGTNFHDGSYWTYNSNKAFSEQFPYASKKQIRTALEKLRAEGYIKADSFNTNPYNKTLWYTLTEKGKSMCLTGQIDVPYRANRDAPEGESSITTINDTTINTDIPNNGSNSKIENYQNVDKVIEEYNRICKSLPKCVRATKKRRDKIATRLKEYTVDDFITAFEMSERSEFLSGRRTRWKASLDWFIQNEDNLAKVLEGRYDEAETGNAESEGHSSGDCEFYEDLPDVW